MRLLAIAATITLALISTAEARGHHHRPFRVSTSHHLHHHHYAGASHGARHRTARYAHARSVRYQCSGCITVETAAGAITVAKEYAERFVGFINDLVTAGYKPKDIGCASSGHMRNSKHHWGGACDIDQISRNKTADFMYHVTELAHEHKLTDGCEWHDKDCGHVEVPTALASRRHSHVRYAHLHHHRHYASGV